MNKEYDENNLFHGGALTGNGGYSQKTVKFKEGNREVVAHISTSVSSYETSDGVGKPSDLTDDQKAFLKTAIPLSTGELLEADQDPEIS